MASPPGNTERRVQEDDYFRGSRRFKDPATGHTIVNVHAGDCFVTDQPDEIAATVLGSCISACVRDPLAKVGGMNHFLLPSSSGAGGDTARFGAYAMELLINEILKRGGARERLEVKLFGGGNVIKSSAKIGNKNAAFAKTYLEMEGLKIIGQDTGGDYPRKIRYYPVSGRALMRKMKRDEDYKKVRAEESHFENKLIAPIMEEDIELF